MGQGYQKFKQRMLLAALWRSILPGVSLALGIFALLFVLHKQLILPLSPLLGAAIGIGCGLLFWTVLFLVLFPYKKRLARKLDKELALREGVQTMLAFADAQDDIAVLQREQTDEKLRALPTKKLKIKHVWTCLVCLVLAIGLTVTAFAIPAKQPEPPPAPVDPPFELGEWEQIALRELIEEVRTSTMTERAKTETVGSLQALLEALQTTKTQGRMKTLVVDTILAVRGFVDGVVTRRSFSPIMSVSGSPYTRALDKALANPEPTAFKHALGGISQEFCKIEDKQLLIEAAHVFSDELKMVLRNAGADEQDALYIEIAALSNAFADVVEKLDVQNYIVKVGHEMIARAFNNACETMGKALMQQQYDAQMGVRVETRLSEIFGLDVQDLPAQEDADEGPQTPGDYTEDDDDQALADGGIGSGELILGSQDVIYDPVRGEYVKYSEVIDAYNAIFIEKKIDGVLSDEIAALIEAYFSALFSPSDKD